MVRTIGGSRLRPRVRFSTPEREEQALVPAPVPAPVPEPVPEAVPEEPQGFKRYQTRMGTPGPFTSATKEIQEGPTLQADPYFRTGGVIIVQASAITVPINSRGDLIALVIACLEDQEAFIRREPHPEECTAPPQRFPWKVVLRHAGADG